MLFPHLGKEEPICYFTRSGCCGGEGVGDPWGLLSELLGGEGITPPRQPYR